MCRSQRSAVGGAGFLFATVLLVIASCADKNGGVDQDDDSYPSAVVDLRVGNVTASSVALLWTAPGGDSTSGRATAYDMRISDHEITWVNFDSCDLLAGEPTPSAYGATDSMTVPGLLEDSTYYFALRAKNSASNWSWVSNCVEAICFDNLVVTFPDPRLDAAVRRELDQPTGPIYRLDLLGVRRIVANHDSVSDMTGLENCSNIEEILCTDNRINNFGAVADLKHLIRAQVSQNQIESLAPLAECTELEQILAGWNLLSNLTGLANLSKLREVYVAGNNVTDISPLANKAALLYVDVSKNQVNDISVLAGSPNMLELNVCENQITAVTALSGMTHLEYLTLHRNQIADISPLAGLGELVMLSLSSNDIADISALGGLTKLRFLYLGQNVITNLDSLARLTGLEQLTLSQNPISDLSPVAGLTALVDFQAQFCQIVDIGPLSGLTNLEKLVLSNNQITDILPLVNNTGLGDGDLLYLSGNPLSDNSISTYIPALEARGVTVIF